MTPDLAIVIATCNRAPLLRRALQAIRATTQCRHHLVIVDGASTDTTPHVLEEFQQQMNDSLHIIREPQREGFVRAVNKGFRAAALQNPRNLMWINDDAFPLAGALDLAVEQMDAAPTTGLLALFHRCEAAKNIAYQTTHLGTPFKLLHIRGTLYANFGLARRETFERLHFFDERYFLNAADPDFALKVWHAGLRVVPAFNSLIDHDEHDDPRRSADSAKAAADNQRLFEKWNLPNKNPALNDFQPNHPCTLQGLK